MLRQSLTFEVLLTLYLNKPNTPAKPVEAALRFSECDEQAVKGTISIRSHVLNFVWSLSYENCAPKFAFPWVPEDVKDAKASRVLAKSALDKFSRICLKLNSLPITTTELDTAYIQPPFKSNALLKEATLVNHHSLTAQEFVLAQGCIRQLNYIASEIQRNQASLSDTAFSNALEASIKERTPTFTPKPTCT
jgi:hypothetical protein